MRVVKAMLLAAGLAMVTAVPAVAHASIGSDVIDYGTPAGVSGDFNGDGASDVLARSPDGVLWVYPGTGSIATDDVLRSRVRVGTGWDFFSTLTTGDFNSDGVSDVLTRSFEGLLWVYPGTGSIATDEVLRSPVRAGTGTGWSFFSTLTTGDFNRDGASDVLARSPGGTLWVYPGTGTTAGGNVLRSPVRVGTGWNFFPTLATGDFNRDGASDVLARSREGLLWVYPGAGSIVTDNVLRSPVRVGTRWDFFPTMSAGDFDRDGADDLLARSRDGLLWAYPGTGSIATDNVLRYPVRVGTGWDSFDALT